MSTIPPPFARASAATYERLGAYREGKLNRFRFESEDIALALWFNWWERHPLSAVFFPARARPPPCAP